MTEPKKYKADELHADAWERFESAVNIVAKSPPQHRAKSVPVKAKKQPKKPPKSKGG
jgi:hypothetical protein